MSLDVYLEDLRPTEVYSNNITHNLGRMAREAGLYEPLWRPEEIHINRAGDLVSVLEEGLTKLKADPDRFRKFNPENGWGDYEGLVRFVESYLEACKETPNATVRASR